MSLTKSLSRSLAPLIAVLTALGALTALSLTAAPAEAAVSAPAAKSGPKVKITPKGPYKKNQTVKVKVSGFPANAQLAVGVCPHGINPKGPGDCGSPGKGFSRLTRVDAQGKLATTLRIPKGKLGATSRPTEKCNNKKKNKCAVFASTIGGSAVSANTKALRYS